MKAQRKRTQETEGINIIYFKVQDLGLRPVQMEG